jgi:hypothetical protein
LVAGEALAECLPPPYGLVRDGLGGGGHHAGAGTSLALVLGWMLRDENGGWVK